MASNLMSYKKSLQVARRTAHEYKGQVSGGGSTSENGSRSLRRSELHKNSIGFSVQFNQKNIAWTKWPIKMKFG